MLQIVYSAIVKWLIPSTRNKDRFLTLKIIALAYILEAKISASGAPDSRIRARNRLRLL